MPLQPGVSMDEVRDRLLSIIREAASVYGCRTFAIGIQYMKNPHSRDSYYDHIANFKAPSDRVKFILSENHVKQDVIKAHESFASLSSAVDELSTELGHPLYVWNTPHKDGAGTCFVERGPLTQKRDYNGKRLHTGIPEAGQVLILIHEPGIKSIHGRCTSSVSGEQSALKRTGPFARR